MRNRWTTTRTLAAIAAIGVVMTGCSGTTAGDKTGSDSLVLRLASIDGANDNGQSFGPQAFIDALGDVSQGRVKVDLTTPFGDGGATAESSLVKEIARGRFDGGWPSVRAFEGAGISGLQPVEAPMTITSYAAEKELVGGPVADELLSRLKGSGLVGLGMAVGPLRRPFAATQPLLSPADWKGARFRAYSQTESDAVTALGAVPAHLGIDWVDQAQSGELRGGEFDLAQYVRNAYLTQAGNVTSNVVLWPKVFVLAISQKRFDSLNDQQRGWVRTAARRAVRASVTATYDESGPARTMCAKGAKFRAASPAQVRDLKTRVQPVVDRLRATNARAMNDILAIAARHPAADAPAVPVACTHGAAASGRLGAIPQTASALPDGVYRSQVSSKDVTANGFAGGDGPVGTWTLKISRGTYELFCQKLENPQTDCGETPQQKPVDVGDVRGTGHTVYFIYNATRLSQIQGCTLPVSQSEPGHCFVGVPVRMRWSVAGDTLTFSDYQAQVSNDQYLINPWRKIG